MRRGVRFVVTGILACANLLTILLMWTSCLTTYISPIEHPRLTQAGLFFPIFLGLNLVFLLVWLLVSKRWMLLPVLGIASCWAFVQDYCPINFAGSRPNEGMLVLSYNVASLSASPSTVFDGNKALDYITSSEADIIFLQECPGSGSMYTRLKNEMTEKGYHMKHGIGLCILSRYPFVGKEVYKTEAAFGNGSMAWCINIDGDTVLLINNHLQSNGINAKEKEDYGNAIDSYDSDKMASSGKALLTRLINAASKRAVQTQKVQELIEQYSGHRIIVAGDMNDTPISPTCQRLADNLVNAYTQSGRGLGISFSSKGIPVRIDHIFFTRHWSATGTHVDASVKASDHHPILTRLHKADTHQ